MVWVLPGPVPGVSVPRGLPALPNTLLGPGLRALETHLTLVEMVPDYCEWDFLATRCKERRGPPCY